MPDSVNTMRQHMAYVRGQVDGGHAVDADMVRKILDFTDSLLNTVELYQTRDDRCTCSKS